MAGTAFEQTLRTYGPDRTAPTRLTPAQARAYCRRLAGSHYENFTVASRLAPRRLRPHLCHLYAYCRWADDLADEVDNQRRSLELLDWWENELKRCYRGEADHPVFVALRETIRQFDLPQQPFVDLLSAFRQDQHCRRYETADELLDYCRRSANPVGRLVLHLGRRSDAERISLSDSICSGLQWINFCQDVSRDWQSGRLYLPAEVRGRHGCDDERFGRGPADGRLRQILKEEVERAEAMLLAGLPLCERMPRGLRLPLRLFVGGGLSIAAAIRRQGFDVWRKRPTLSKFDKLRLLGKCIGGKSRWHTAGGDA